MQTIRERHKSAPYLRLKNSKRTSQCQVFSSTIPENQKVGMNWRAKRGDPLDFSTFLSQNMSINTKLKGGTPFEVMKVFSKKKSHNAEKTGRGTL